MTMKNFRAVDMPSGASAPAPEAPAPAQVEFDHEPVALITDEGVATIVDAFVDEGGAVTNDDAPTV